MRSPVAVIDIGSNSIKLLVAARDTAGNLQALQQATLDVRISAGLSRARPFLGETGMADGLAAIPQLLALAAPFQPDRTILVATSAVRDAENGAEFRTRVAAATGQTVRILTGAEEAGLIGRGLLCDPALAGFENFYVFDLGGGSLECLSFHQQRIVQALSLRLGCVRLTEQFVADVATPFSDQARAAVAGHTRAELVRSGFRFDVPGGRAVFAGGSMTTARAILAARAGRPLAETPPVLSLLEIRVLLDTLAALPLAARRSIPGLPAARADVFPTALATMLAVAETGGLTAFHHSFYNLRWGLAAEALGQGQSTGPR